MNTATTADDSITSLTGASKIPLIAIVDDNESVRVALKSLIDSVGFHAETFAAGEEFLSSRLVAETDCLIADVRMPGGMSGLELQEQLKTINSGLPIILISAHDDGDARTKALRAGAIDFLQKPFSEELLLGAIAAALHKS
jgi:FixJ family two-component response regulator